MMGVSGCVILLVPELDILRSVGSLEPIDSNRGRAHLLPQILDRVTPSKVAPQRNFSFDWTKQKPLLCVGVVQMLARNTASRYIPGKKKNKKTLLRVLSTELRVPACLEKYLTYNLALEAPGCPSCQPQKHYRLRVHGEIRDEFIFTLLFKYSFLAEFSLPAVSTDGKEPRCKLICLWIN